MPRSYSLVATFLLKFSRPSVNAQKFRRPMADMMTTSNALTQSAMLSENAIPRTATNTPMMTVTVMVCRPSPLEYQDILDQSENAPGDKKSEPLSLIEPLLDPPWR